MTIRVLGPFELTADDRPVSLTAGRLRSLLVVLAMSAGKPVSFDLLASAVWGEELPGNARRSLQNYAGRLRAAVGAARVDSSAAGFALLVDEDDVDALRFVRLLDEAAHLPGVGAERSQLVEALGLWRGEPYEGVRSEWLHQNHAPRLVERYLSALERRIDLDLTHGRNGDLTAELGELTTRYPLRESLWVRMLAALSQSGRHAEALEAYETIRGRIADELGVDPGPELRQAHADLLAGRAPVAQHDGGRPPPAVVPRQLPAVIDRLAGRGDAMKELDGLLTDDRRTPSVCVITGTAGVGKTTLAVRWARRMAGRFPDGQLYVDLGGFGPSEEVAEPADVLRDFLGALSVSPARVPSSTAALTGLFRSLLTGKRVLVLLDNARDADQVRPLLPSSLDCLTLITSRNDMAGLVVTEAAHPISLDVLSPAEAWQLLATRLGQDRASQDPRAVESIIRACARLPLALAIVAARATLHPSLSLAALATGLRDAHDDLDALDTGDAVTNVRAVFSWSYRAITPEAARLFRLLGLHPGPEISVAAAASLAARPMPQAKALLVQLQQANLVNWSAADRYRPHDLLWAYARELVEREHTESERHGAVRRLVEHYLHTACAADRLLDPVRDPITPHSRTEDVATESLPDKESAHAWMTTERHVLLAVCKQAADQGLDIHVWQLAWAVTTFLDRQGLWHDWAWTQQLALRAAERLDDGSETARAHRALGRAETRLYRYSDAHTHFTQAVRLYTELADPVGQAITHINIGWMFECQEEFGQALRHNERALELFEQCDHKVGQAKVLNALGWDYAKLGDYSTALPFCERSLKLNLELDDGFGQAETWDSLGYIHLNRGDHRQAIVCYEHALELHYELGATALAASILRDIGDAYSVAGDMPTARTYHLRALAIMEELHDPDADQVRARLRGYAEQRDS